MGERPDYEGVRRGSGTSIEIDFFYCGKRCRERIKLKPTPANLKKAYLHRLAILEAIDNGTFDYAVTFPTSKRADHFSLSSGLTVQEYLESWIDGLEPYLKASTLGGYRKIINNQLVPAFGKVPLRELTLKTIKQWALALESTPKTIGNTLSPLRVALDDAVEDEIIQVNPMSGWKFRRRKKAVTPKNDPIDPFTTDERTAILSALSDTNRNMVQFWLWTGLRTSELVALDWPDIDFINAKARINKAYTQASKFAEEPKTTAGDRVIDLPAPAIAALEAQKQHSWLKGEEIFPNPRTGDRWTGDQPIRKTMWTPTLKRAGVRYRYPYQCRHTFATMMLDAGENIRWISAQLGHTDWTFTARTYTRFMPEEYQGAGNKAVEKYSLSPTIPSTNTLKP